MNSCGDVRKIEQKCALVVKERNLVEISGIMHLMISHMEAVLNFRLTVIMAMPGKGCHLDCK